MSAHCWAMYLRLMRRYVERGEVVSYDERLNAQCQRLGKVVNRVAAIYDIHGNLPALEAVLLEIDREQPDMIVVGGDVLPGPMPTEVLERLLRLVMPTVYIPGNGDREVLSRKLGNETEWYRSASPIWRLPVDWTAKQLSAKHVKLIAGWPPTHQIQINGLGEVLFCHATPLSDTEIFTCRTPEHRLAHMLEHVRTSIVVCGHTHMQFSRVVGTTQVVNAGSVGMPIGNTGAFWLLLDSTARLKRTEYDLEGAAQQVRNTSYPYSDQFANESILNPISESVMFEAYEKIADGGS